MSDQAKNVAVKTYVSPFQKDEWVSHADQLDMTQSEFLRTMVQAGRRGFEPADEEPHSGGASPGGDGLKDRVLESLAEEPKSWDELLGAASGGIEARLEEALDELQAGDRIRYSGRHGGYTIAEGE